MQSLNNDRSRRPRQQAMGSYAALLRLRPCTTNLSLANNTCIITPAISSSNIPSFPSFDPPHPPPDETVPVVSSDDGGGQVEPQESGGIEQNLHIVDFLSPTPLRCIPASIYHNSNPDAPGDILEEVEGSDTDSGEEEHHRESAGTEKIAVSAPASTWRPLHVVPISQILSGIPQTPFHNRQHGRFSELTRRNLAAAWNQTFEDVVKQIQELNKEEIWVRFGELWHTMTDLQGMGYNVLPMRRRLVEKMELIEKMKEAEWRMEELKREQMIGRLERVMVENQITDLRKKMIAQDLNLERMENEIDALRETLALCDAALNLLAMKPLMDF